MLRRRRILFLLFIFTMSCFMLVHELSVQSSSENPYNGKMPIESRHEREKWYSFNGNCKAKHNVLLLKTHKTGSSTIQNILVRYADEHQLKLVLPTKNNYFGHPEPFNRSMLYSNQASSKSTNSSLSIENNIFAFHARFNYREMKAVMPSDTIFITVLREPVKLMESLVLYYNLPRTYHLGSATLFMSKFFSATPNTSKFHATHTERLGRRYGRNQMSFDLGMDKDDFDDTDKVTDFIKSIDSQFHLVMIAERMDESLILLQHLLCWTLDDIIAFRQNARSNATVEQISSELEQRMRHFNKADQLLYEYFSAKFDRQVQAFGVEEMNKQVTSLRDATQAMYERCVGKVVSKSVNFAPIYARAKVNVVRYKLKVGTNETCKHLTVDELTYLPQMRIKQGEKNQNEVPAKKKSIRSSDIEQLLRLKGNIF